MDELSLKKKLAGLPLGETRYFQQTGSTNDIALAWAGEGAPDFSLVIADEQTAGRGRQGRRWLTPPGSALAVSVIFHPSPNEIKHPSLFSGLGALALALVLQGHGIAARVKWPNDVLISGRKTAGILVDTAWIGAQIESIVMGIGVNVLPESVPPDTEVLYPATCVYAEGLTIDRHDLLWELLTKLIELRPKMGEAKFIPAWQESLAFMNERVQVWAEPAPGQKGEPLTGYIRGLDMYGGLKLETSDGIRPINFGEIRLRPAK
jgi:BirA family transcriptional regulator, biotin operon repressor / biotin---[acetyl-CoA-carboxylase] ligase